VHTGFILEAAESKVTSSLNAVRCKIQC